MFTVEESATAACEFWYALPPGFYDLAYAELSGEPDAADADTRPEAVQHLLDAAPGEEVRRALEVGRRVFQALRAQGVVRCFLGLHRDDASGAVLRSLLTISWLGTAWASPALTAARAAVVPGEDHVEIFDVAVGPASLREATLTPASAGDRRGDSLIQLAIHIPHPDGKRLVILTLVAAAASQREKYRTLLRMMAEMITFENPQADKHPR